jgi:hypothetical protein
VRILNEHGRELPHGQTGRIFVGTLSPLRDTPREGRLPASLRGNAEADRRPLRGLATPPSGAAASAGDGQTKERSDKSRGLARSQTAAAFREQA